MAISQRASGIKSRIEQLKNQVLDPASRQKNLASIKAFAYDRPLFTFFITTHLLFSTIPITLFLSFATGTVILSLVAAILFSLFWVISALVVLVATLSVTISIGMTVWAWGAGGITFSKWAYNKLAAADKELSETISGKNGTKEAGNGAPEKFGHLNGEVNDPQNQNQHGGDNKVTTVRDEYVIDKKIPKRGDFGIGVDRKLVNQL